MSVEFGDEISLEVNTRVRALEHLIQQRKVAGVVETVPTYRALLVYYDPFATGYAELIGVIAALVPEAEPATLPPSRVVELPVAARLLRPLHGRLGRADEIPPRPVP